jgi:hypothetical protein
VPGCHERLLVQLSTERQYSGDSYFREQGFYSNKFTQHFPMDPNACLCYPSQPGVTRTFPQPIKGGRICTPGDPHSHLQCRSSFTGDTQWLSGEGARSQVVAASCQGLGTDSGSMVSDGRGSKRGFGLWLVFIYLVVTSPPLLSALSP